VKALPLLTSRPRAVERRAVFIGREAMVAVLNKCLTCQKAFEYPSVYYRQVV
jgi:hypothetical protein